MGIRKQGHVTDEELSLLIDKELNERTARRVQDHLRQCATCQKRYEEMVQTVVLLQKAPRVSVPRAFTLTEADVTPRIHHRRRVLPWLRWATAFVAAMLLVVVGLDVITASIVGPMGAARPQPEMALQAKSVTSPVPAEKAPKAAITPVARVVSPPAPVRLRAAGEAPARPTPASVQPVPENAIQPAAPQEAEAPTSTSATERASRWPWYRWAEMVLAGILLLLLILQVVLK